MKITAVHGKAKPIEEQIVSAGDLIIVGSNVYYAVQCGNNSHKLINMTSGNRQRDIGEFVRDTPLKDVLNRNNLPITAQLVKLGDYRMELEY